MRVFIDARGFYDVMPEKENLILGCFTNLKQAQAFVLSKGFKPMYTWEDLYV